VLCQTIQVLSRTIHNIDDLTGNLMLLCVLKLCKLHYVNSEALGKHKLGAAAAAAADGIENISSSDRITSILYRIIHSSKSCIDILNFKEYYKCYFTIWRA